MRNDSIAPKVRPRERRYWKLAGATWLVWRIGLMTAQADTGCDDTREHTVCRPQIPTHHEAIPRYAGG